MNNDGRIASLDGLRALAIFLVVSNHLLLRFTTHLPYLGNFGVKVFFVISGFLITSILAAEFEKTETINLKRFYFRRTLRIFPAYYFYIFVIFLTKMAGVYPIPLTDFISSLTYTSNYFPTDSLELGHSWSLAVEEQFYLIYPGLFFLLGLKKIKRVLIFVVLLAPLIRLLTMYLFYSGGNFSLWLVFAFHTNMDALAIGCLLAFYRKELHANKYYQRFLGSPAAFISLPFIVSAVFYYPEAYLFLFTLGWTILNLLIVSGIDWLIFNSDSSIFGRLFNLAPVKYIGVLSYSIYLWQQPFSIYSENLIWTHYPFNLIMIIVFSLISYYLIERNFLKLRKHSETDFFLRFAGSLRNTESLEMVSKRLRVLFPAKKLHIQSQIQRSRQAANYFKR